MTNKPLSSLQQVLQRLSGLQALAGESDEQVLQRFIESRDEAAFEALLHRHGRMVWGVCRRLLTDVHDAEDAFQASFLVLVRKAAAIAGRGQVGHWLYGVAYRVAMKARARAARRREREGRSVDRHIAEPTTEAGWNELEPLLDRELERLPPKYRLPILLCGIEGRTHEEAGQLLGWPTGTVSGRLSRARELLRRRLARRGVLVSAVAFTTLLAQNAASAGVPTALLSATRAAAGAGTASLGSVSASVTALVESVARELLVGKLKLATAWVVIAGMIGLGAGLAAMNGFQPAPTNQAEGRATPSAIEGETAQRPEAPAEAPASAPVVPQEVGVSALPPPANWQAQRKIRLGDTPPPVATVSPDGKLAASVIDLTSIQIWDLGTGKPLAKLTGRTGGVSVLAFSPDGSLLAATHQDGAVKVWNVASRTARWTFQGHRLRGRQMSVVCLAFSADGRYLASGSADQTINVWDLTKGQVRATLRGHRGMVCQVALSPDGRTVASVGMDGALRIWDAATSKEQSALPARQMEKFQFTTDGKTLVTLQPLDDQLTLWNVATGRERGSLKFPKRHNEDGLGLDLVESFVLAADGRTLATGSREGYVAVYDAGTGTMLALFQGHDGFVHTLTFSADGRTLTTAGGDGIARTWIADILEKKSPANPS